jgi:hypothetical protein
LYRAPSDVDEFLRRLDQTSKYLYNTKSEFIICGNMNYFNEYNHKKQGNSLLKPYIFTKTVICATRIQNSSSTAIDNIVMNLRYAGHPPPPFQR